MVEEQRAAVRQALGALSGLLPVGLVAVDADGLCWYENQRWEDICGITGLALRDQPWYEAVHESDRARVATAWRPQVSTRGHFGEFRAVSAEGVVTQCRGETIPMVGTDGVVHGHLVMIRDADDYSPLGTLTNAPNLDALLDWSHDIITILNADGTWRWSSGGALRLLGHMAEFNPEDGIFSLLHPDDVDESRRVLDKIVADGGHTRMVVRVRVADGSYRHLEALTDSLIHDPAVRGIVIHARDVTDRVETLAELEASNRRLADLIATMHTAMVLEDEHRRVMVTNQAFVDLFLLPISPAELVGRTLESVGWAPGALLESVTGRRQRTEGIRITLFDGRILECDCVPMFVHQEFRGHLLVVRDVTDQARAQAERERLLASERQENRRLAELDAFKSEFMASVSHELRTPLTSIVAYSQMLERLVRGRDDSGEVEILEVIQRNVARILRLSGDLLTLDSLESGALPLTLTWVDVAGTARHAAHSIEPAASERGVRIECATLEGQPMWGDAERIGQLFDNLLSNAVKFTPAGGLVRMQGRPTAEGWRISVSDTGMGIPDDEQKLLFDRFFRASNVTRLRLPGVGLGLSIAQAIAEIHQGTIAVRSTLGAGSEITVTLRGHPDEPAPAGSAPEAVTGT
jgi:PAS domain S-box-containing protein